MRGFTKNHCFIFYSCWLILGLIQARFTELQDDEAYYWVYSRFLDWGYFDHPPMIAVLIKMGYAIFPNELGVRLFPLLLNILSLVLIEKLIEKKKPLLFYAIVLSMAVIQLTGFIAVPDIPLIFFTALFFWRYKKFIADLSLVNTLWLGVSIALLFYSKYHAILIVLFTLLSNVRLLNKYQTWLAGFIALFLFAPHLWWQYQHDWVSIRYHLFESNINAYQPSFTLSYFIGQVLLPGPIAGFILLPVAFLYRPANKTEKALRYTMIGLYAFFLLSSFRGKVEGNWTSPVLVSLIVLAHQYLNAGRTRMAKWGQTLLYKLLPVTLLLVLLARIIMIVDLLPIKEIQSRYHAWKTWPKEMNKRTKGLPVVFSNSYQRASKYWFYSGQITYSQNWYRERRNNYNFWPIEDSLLGKPVYFMDKYMLYRFPDSLNTPIGWIGYKYDSSFASFAKVLIEPLVLEYKVKQKDSLVVQAIAIMSPVYATYISNHTGLRSTIVLGIFNTKGWIKDFATPLTLQQITRDRFSIILYPGLPKGKYYLLFSIRTGEGNATHNSRKISVVIE